MAECPYKIRPSAILKAKSGTPAHSSPTFVPLDHELMPSRFSRLISLCGFTQQEAAEYLGIAHKTVSMKSAGMRKISEEEEHQLASLWLVISDPDQPLPENLPRGGQERRRAITEVLGLINPR